MKLVPESLKESQNFERGLDPKAAMDIGVNRPLKIGDQVYLLSRADFTPFDRAVITRFQTPEEIEVKTQGGSIIVMPIQYLERARVHESQGFQRGLDPKHAMGIGDAAILPQMITSNDLEGVSFIDQWDEMLDPDRDADQIEEDDKRYAYLQRVKRFIKGKVTFGEYFDWKEDQEMYAYIQKYARGRHVYTYTPGQDGSGVAFSKIEFPNAEEIQ